jgi:HSP20 family protein
MRDMMDPLSIGRAWTRAGGLGPPVDLYETADAVVIRLAVPGAEGASLSLTIEEDSVTLRGETPAPGRGWDQRTLVHWQEIPHGRFQRTVPLPTPVRRDAARAQFRNGILEIRLPKHQQQLPRTIQIAVG